MTGLLVLTTPSLLLLAPAEAAPVWRACLRAEPGGPWAEVAREWLEAAPAPSPGP